MIYADAFILYEYHGNVGFWVWWWSAGVNPSRRINNVILDEFGNIIFE